MLEAGASDFWTAKGASQPCLRQKGSPGGPSPRQPAGDTMQLEESRSRSGFLFWGTFALFVP